MEPLARSLHPEAVDVAARAFDTDPLFSYLAPHPPTRAKFLRAAFTAYAKIAPDHVSGVRVDGSVAAMSLLIPAGAYPPSPLRAGPAVLGALARGLPRGAFRASMLPRVVRAATLVEEAHPPHRFHYLELLVVAPDMQGRGLGSGMLRALTDRLDRSPDPTVLETAKETNVRLYRRFGFEVIRTSRFDDSPLIWTMERPPAR